MDEGYGLSQDAVENCLRQHPVTLLLAVDCGTTAVASIAWLRTQAVDVIVLDHHLPEGGLPPAVALPFALPLTDEYAARTGAELLHLLGEGGRIRNRQS